jgi:hypothetical protein
MGRAAQAQGEALSTSPPRAAVQQTENPQAVRQATCEGIRAEINNIDAQARQPQSGRFQDWIKQRRQTLSDQRFRMQC